MVTELMKNYTITIPVDIYSRTELCDLLSNLLTSASKSKGNSYTYKVSFEKISDYNNFKMSFEVNYNLNIASAPKFYFSEQSAFAVLGFNAKTEEKFQNRVLISKNKIPYYDNNSEVFINIPNGFETFGLNPGKYGFIDWQFMTLNINFLFITFITVFKFSVSSILHEFLHFMGMIHTHQAIENNPIITWNIEIITKYFEENNIDVNTIEDQIINRLHITDQIAGEFDKLSIMTYRIKSDWNAENIDIDMNFKLSEIDKKGLSDFYGPASKPLGYIPEECKEINQNSLKIIENYNMFNNTCKNLKIFALILIIAIFILYIV
jgi:hypothetical protein